MRLHILTFFILFASLILQPLTVQAQAAPKPTPVYGYFEVLQNKTSIDAFLEANKGNPVTSFMGYIVNLITAVIVFIGLIVITIGTYFYMTAGGEADGAKKGKVFITSALLGIALALTAWIILNTINPAIFNEPVLKKPPQLNP